MFTFHETLDAIHTHSPHFRMPDTRIGKQYLFLSVVDEPIARNISPDERERTVCQQRPRGINLRSFPGHINSLANLSLFVDFSVLILEQMDFESLDGTSSSWRRDAVFRCSRRCRYDSPLVSSLLAFPLTKRISFRHCHSGWNSRNLRVDTISIAEIFRILRLPQNLTLSALPSTADATHLSPKVKWEI